MKLAVVGVTGLVGGVMLKVLEEFNFPVTELLPVASDKSVGKTVVFKNREYKVISNQQAVAMSPQIALFSAGGKTSLEWAPRYAEAGCYVIDNSSAWRMHENIKLVVPEINAHEIGADDKIIANPNCSTIQMVLALCNLHKRYHIKRLVVSTYQSVTGTGVKAVKQLENERAGIKGDMAYPYEIDRNCFPHGGDFTDNGYTTEEVKLVNETRKILSAPEMQITATVVRIPVFGGHSECVNAEFENEFELSDTISEISNTPGVVVQDEPARNIYPMPKYSEGKNDVFVGRIRRDYSNPKTLNMWVVADNLRKGAATNAVQIAEYLVTIGFVK